MRTSFKSFLALCILPATLAAQTAPPSGTPSRPAPAPQASAKQAPIRIEADRAELTERGGASVYTGNVKIKQGDLEMEGERLQLERGQSGEVTATLTGSPARAQQPGAEGLIKGQAQRIDYVSKDKTMVLQGNAEVLRGKDRIQSEKIRYDTATQRIIADGNGKSGDRVQITIDPDKAQGR
jgi:lipopolysaccharide export system protein LptA